MRRIRHTPEQILRKLRLAEAELSGGMALEDVVKRLEISQTTYLRWRREYGKTNPERMRELKDLAKCDCQAPTNQNLRTLSGAWWAV